MESSQQKMWVSLLLGFSIFEFLMLSYLEGYFGIYFSPIIFFVCSIGVACMALYRSSFSINIGNIVKNRFSAELFFIPLLAGLIFFGYSKFSQHPIDDNQSDVFAQVLSPSRWILNGQYPYQQVVLPTYTMHNTYLPMQWMPFIIAVAFGFDPRWIPILAWSGVFFLFVRSVHIPLPLKIKDKLPLMLIFIISITGIFGFIAKNTFDYCVTIELLPAAYYILLVLFLLNGSWLGIGISLGFCLMSRFSIVLFIPFMMWYAWKRFGFTVLWRSAATSVIFIMCIFVLPFMSRDAQLPQKILGNYDSGAVGEWRTHDWQEAGSEPHQLARGLGAAIFVKKLYEYNVADGVRHLKHAEIFLSILITFFMIYFYQRNRAFLDHDWVLLGGIKLYFTIFYSLAIIPYPYLFVIPVSITSLILIKAYADISGSASVPITS